MVNESGYLDYAASTPVDERVVQVMSAYFGDFFGNPSSVHSYGQKAERAVEQARDSVARLVGAQTDEIVFTSCGTESDNLALRGTAWRQRLTKGKNHILTTPVEHHAVLHTALQLEEQGFKVEMLPVDRFGMVDPEDVRKAVRKETAIVSVIYANNEIGTINPIREIGEVCRENGVPFHTDAVQAAAHMSMDVERDQVDLLSIGAHKFYGPKGVGALYIRKGTPIEAAQTGGKQEHGFRAGTHNVPYIVGLAEAFKLTNVEMAERNMRYLAMRDHLIGEVLETIPGVQLSGHFTERLPNHASFVFQHVDGNRLLMMLDLSGYACSSGSACKTGDPQPSDVLTALGFDRAWALGSLRVSMGRSTTPQVVDAFLGLLKNLIEKIRG